MKPAIAIRDRELFLHEGKAIVFEEVFVESLGTAFIIRIFEGDCENTKEINYYVNIRVGTRDKFIEDCKREGCDYNYIARVAGINLDL